MFFVWLHSSDDCTFLEHRLYYSIVKKKMATLKTNDTMILCLNNNNSLYVGEELKWDLQLN